jgi:hypothetical protein
MIFFNISQIIQKVKLPKGQKVKRPKKNAKESKGQRAINSEGPKTKEQNGQRGPKDQRTILKIILKNEKAKESKG